MFRFTMANAASSFWLVLTNFSQAVIKALPTLPCVNARPIGLLGRNARRTHKLSRTCEGLGTM